MQSPPTSRVRRLLIALLLTPFVQESVYYYFHDIILVRKLYFVPCGFCIVQCNLHCATFSMDDHWLHFFWHLSSKNRFITIRQWLLLYDIILVRKFHFVLWVLYSAMQSPPTSRVHCGKNTLFFVIFEKKGKFSDLFAINKVRCILKGQDWVKIYNPFCVLWHKFDKHQIGQKSPNPQSFYS